MSRRLDADLLSAVKAGDLERTKALLTQRADVNHAFGDQGVTPLHMAASFGYADVAKALVVSGADQLAQTTDNLKLTPVQVATSEKGNKAAKVLQAEYQRMMMKADALMRTPGGSSPRVLLRAYDLGKLSFTQVFNSWTKSYPALHTGVQVYNLEFSFGMTTTNDTGICVHPVGACQDHTFKESLHMGYTELSKAEVFEVIRSMEDSWRGNTYSALSKNCHHFSDEFCMRLVNRNIPSWINDLAGVGKGLCSCAIRDSGQPPGRRSFPAAPPAVPHSSSLGSASSPLASASEPTMGDEKVTPSRSGSPKPW